MILSFVVPIAIASFFGSIFSASDSSEPAKIDVSIVDHDNSAISKSILAGIRSDKSLKVSIPAEPAARDAVKRGKTTVAAIIPKGFGDAAGKAFLGIGAQPALGFLYDPSHRTELAMVRGILVQHVMEAVSKAMFGGSQGRSLVDQTLPQIESSTMEPTQKAALLQMLKSVQGFYNQQPAGDTSAGGASVLLIPPRDEFRVGYGLIKRCVPSLLINLMVLVPPSASTCTYVGSDSPPIKSPAPM